MANRQRKATVHWRNCSPPDDRHATAPSGRGLHPQSAKHCATCTKQVCGRTARTLTVGGGTNASKPTQRVSWISASPRALTCGLSAVPRPCTVGTLLKPLLQIGFGRFGRRRRLPAVLNQNTARVLCRSMREKPISTISATCSDCCRRRSNMSAAQAPNCAPSMRTVDKAGKV